MSTNSDALFDSLFDASSSGLAPTLVTGKALGPAVTSPAWTSRLDALRGPDLTAALKRLGTKQLLTEWRHRSTHGVADGLTRQQLILNVALAIEPERLRLLDEPKEIVKLVKNVNLAMTVADDPTGVKRDAAALARTSQFSLAGQVGAQDTKVRRAALAAATGESVSSKYTDEEVRMIRRMCELGWKDEAVAHHFGDRTKQAMIWAIRKGVSYKSVSGIADASSCPPAPAPVTKATQPKSTNRR